MLGDGSTMSKKIFQEDNRRKKVHSDCKLKAEDWKDDGKEFDVHKVIMASGSSFFRVLFDDALKRTDRDDTIVVVPGVTSEILNEIIEYIYHDKCDINCDNVRDLMVAAGQFLMVDLFNECGSHIMSQMNKENCISIWRFGLFYKADTLAKNARHFILANFRSISTNSEEFEDLQVTELAEILGDDRLNVDDERIVWDSIVKWIQCCERDRISTLTVLVNNIRLGLIEDDFIQNEMLKHKYVRGDNSNLQEYFHSICRTAPPNQIRSLDCRWPQQVIVAIGGWSAPHHPADAIETYDVRTNRWTTIERMDPWGPRAFYSCVSLSGGGGGRDDERQEVLMVGGTDGTNNKTVCTAFDPVTGRWREIGPMHQKRCYLSAVSHEGRTYAMGGHDGYRRLNTVEKYDPATNQWTMMASMRYVRSDAGATVLDGKIYIVGGINETERLDTAEVYDPDGDTWSEITPMTGRRGGVGCVGHGGFVYALGGTDGQGPLNSVERYNPSTHIWTRVSDMTRARTHFAVQVLENRIFVIGGDGGWTTIDDVECYDANEDRWHRVCSMAYDRSGLGTFVLSNVANLPEYLPQDRRYNRTERRSPQATERPS